VGATASGFATGSFDIGCTTCGHYLLQMSGNPTPLVGGTGFTSAAFDYTGTPDRVASGVPSDYTLAGGASMAATASIVGPLGTPLLGARAGADNASAFLTSNLTVPIGVDYYIVNSRAEVVQRYTYTGATAATYTFNFSLDGTITDRRSSVEGAAGFYDDFLEVNYAFGNSFHQGTGLATAPSDFADSFSVTMTFNPGDSYLMKSWLGASVAGEYASADAFADAMHTMQVTSVTGGNTSLLVPTLLAAPVPEPASALLAMLGLGLLACNRRRA
jgi:hypothetical protein